MMRGMSITVARVRMASAHSGPRVWTSTVGPIAPTGFGFGLRAVRVAVGLCALVEGRSLVVGMVEPPVVLRVRPDRRHRPCRTA